MKKLVSPLIILTSATVLSFGVAAGFADSFPLTNDVASVACAQEDALDFSALDEAAPPADAGQASLPADDLSADAQVPSNQTPMSKEPASSQRAKFVDLVLAGGWIGLILLISSILAVSLIIRLCLTLRRSVVAPNDLAEEISADVKSGYYRSAFEKASQSDLLLGRVLANGLREIDRGWNAVEKALEDAISSETAALYRRTDPLSIIGNVAPMLGLLGTVVGMVSTFGELAIADATGRNLANGIYFALVTTVDGLVVAIPVLVAHSLLNARIAGLIAFVAAQVDSVVEPIKRGDEPQVVRPATSPNTATIAPSTPKATPEGTNKPSSPVENAQIPKTPGLREVARRPTSDPSATRPALSLKSRTAPNRPTDSDEA